jgi:ABC-2 type transport system ATP-binding protein
MKVWEKINIDYTVSMTTSALIVENLTVTLGKKEIIHGISFSVEAGQVFGYLGPNGAGKTTTLRAILGLIPHQSWNISVLGQSSFHQDIFKDIWFLPESAYLYKYLTGREFLQFCGGFYDLSKAELQDSMAQWAERVQMTHALDSRLETYSKGMLQRIGLAQTLLHKPKLVFLDEPMSGLDPIGRRMVKDIIQELKASGTTVVFNTHILSDVEDLCDAFAIIHRWNIVRSAQVQELQGKSVESIFLKAIEEAGGIRDHEIV